MRGEGRVSVRAALGLRLIAAMLTAAPAAAQSPTAAAVIPEPAVTWSVDGTRLQASVSRYELRVLRDSLVERIGERVVQVAETAYAGRAAWAVTERVTLVRGGEQVDSLLVTRETLHPMHRESTIGGAQLMAEFTRDSMVGAVAGPTSRRSLAHPVPPGAVVSAPVLEAMLRATALSSGWRANVPLLVIDLAGARAMLAELGLIGEERIETPAGSHDCWVLTLRAGTQERQLWVRREDALLVRSTERLPTAPGAVLEMQLLGG